MNASERPGLGNLRSRFTHRRLNVIQWPWSISSVSENNYRALKKTAGGFSQILPPLTLVVVCCCLAV